jgi:FMN phosphatase YigB (HAD superfamily)
LYDYFDDVRANDIVFGPSGIISHIESTPYDFERKPLFLKHVIEDIEFSPMDVLFVGNSRNDVWATQSGMRTLCVNPRFTDPDEQSERTYASRKMENLTEILTYVRL